VAELLRRRMSGGVIGAGSPMDGMRDEQSLAGVSIDDDGAVEFYNVTPRSLGCSHAF